MSDLNEIGLIAAKNAIKTHLLLYRRGLGSSGLVECAIKTYLENSDHQQQIMDLKARITELEADIEVNRIMNLSDEEIIAEAKIEFGENYDSVVARTKQIIDDAVEEASNRLKAEQMPREGFQGA